MTDHAHSALLYHWIVTTTSFQVGMLQAHKGLSGIGFVMIVEVGCHQLIEYIQIPSAPHLLVETTIHGFILFG
jgi:hypothetical protein